MATNSLLRSTRDAKSPRYRLTVDHDAQSASLYMETFDRSTEDSSLWQARPEADWILVAIIEADRLTLRPVHTNPEAKRYLSPQHGRIETIVYVDDAGIEELPETANDARMQVSHRLPWGLFKASEDEWGLSIRLGEFWRTLLLQSDCSTLVIAKFGSSGIHDDKIVVNEAELDGLRRSMNRVRVRKRKEVRMAQQTVVFNELLTKLDPARFVRPSEPRTKSTSALIQRRPSQLERRASRASVAALQANLPTLAVDAPETLLDLRAQIERVTLAQMIARYEERLTKNLDESSWQRFFELNVFVLTLAFARPVRLLHTQFHARGSSIDGTGAHVGDFLFREMGQGLALVEIKKPTTILMREAPYRNTEVFAPSGELSGAITQTLLQQSHIRSQWLVHRDSRLLRESKPDVVQCVVIAGTSPSDENQRRSFEVYRSACKDLDIVTFDELLEKMRLLLAHLAPKSPAVTSEETAS